VLSTKPLRYFQVDLIDLAHLAGSNHKIRYLINFIDVMSKYVWCYPAIRKTSESILTRFERWIKDLQNLGVNLQANKMILQSDNGSEFINQEVKELLAANNFKQLFSRSHTPQSNGHIERLNQTLKRAIYSYLTQNRTKQYFDKLDTIVMNYNNSLQSTIGTSPALVVKMWLSKDGNLTKVGERLKGGAKQKLMKQTRLLHGDEEVLKVGQKVRLALEALFPHIRKQKHSKIGVWAKEYTQQWSNEIFTITNRKKWQDKQYIYQVDGESTPGIWWRRQDMDLVKGEVVQAPQSNQRKPVQEVLFEEPIEKLVIQREPRPKAIPKRLEDYVVSITKDAHTTRQVIQPTEEQARKLKELQLEDENQPQKARRKQPLPDQAIQKLNQVATLLIELPIPTNRNKTNVQMVKGTRRSTRKRTPLAAELAYH